MNLKSFFRNKLTPAQIKKAKWSLMQARYLKGYLQRKKGRLEINCNLVEEKKLYSLPNKHIFFGYYDLQQLDPTDTKMLAHIVDGNATNSGNDTAELVYIDLINDEIIHIAETIAWSWQQGARLRWHPSDPKFVMYNTIINGEYCTTIHNLETKEKSYTPFAFYDVTPNGKIGLGLNFARLQRLRPGYGYSCIPDTTKGDPAPRNEGVYRYDLITGKITLLVSLRQLALDIDPKLENDHYINHISIAPSGNKFMFFHIWVTPHSSNWNMKLFIADIFSGKKECIENEKIVSHYCWKNDNNLLITTAGLNGLQPSYFLYNLQEQTKTKINGEWLEHDGHPSYMDGTMAFVSDTYPIKSMQYVFMHDGEIETELIRVYSDPRLFDDMRCDLHPRITKSCNILTVDTTCVNKVRSILLAKFLKNEESQSSVRFEILCHGNRTLAIKEMFHEVTNNIVDGASYHELFVYNNKLIELLHRIIYKQKLSPYFRWFPKKFWVKYHYLSNTSFSFKNQTYIIFAYGTDLHLLHFPDLIKKTKLKYGKSIKTVLLLFDSISSPLNLHGWNEIEKIMDDFDLVASFDAKDAKTYNLLYFTSPYVKRKNISESPNKSDLFFVGAEKGRGNLLKEISDTAKETGTIADIKVAGLSKKYSFSGLQKLDTYLEYNEMLTFLMSTNCVLEILCEGQFSPSLRYYEAIVYNKKLLTNNPNIFNLPYYSHEYMRYFRAIEDIDFDWIKKNINVNYNYCGDFSINALFEKILEADKTSNSNRNEFL